MIAQVAKYHSMASGTTLWFASISLREFAKDSRIFAAFTPGANRARTIFFPRRSALRNFGWHSICNAANERNLNP